MITLAFQAGISRSTTLPTPIVDFRAADYVAGATTWTNRGSAGGTGTIPTGGMNKTSSGVDAVSFGGDSSNDRVESSIGSTSTFDKVSVELWIKMLDSGSDETAAGSMLFSWVQPSSSGNYNVYHTQNKVGFNTFQSDLYGIDSTSYTNRWTHLVFVMSDVGNQAEQKIYVDGVLQSTSCLISSSSTDSACTTTSTRRVFNSNGDFWLMDNPRSSTTTWREKSEVGMVRVYAQELTAAEVQAAYDATKSLGYVTTTTTSSTSTTTTSSTSTTTTSTTSTTTTTTTTTVPASTTTGPAATTTVAPVVTSALPTTATTAVTTPTTAGDPEPVGTPTASTLAATRSTPVLPPPTTARAPAPLPAVSPATTTTTTSTTTTTLAPPPPPPGGSSDGQGPTGANDSQVLVDGKAVDVAVRTDGDTLTASFGEVTLQMSVLSADGTVQPLVGDATLSVDAGSKITLAMAGLAPESIVEAWIYSDPVILGREQTSTGGVIDTVLGVPDTLNEGQHTLVIRGTDATGADFVYYGSTQMGDIGADSGWVTYFLVVPLIAAAAAGIFLPPALRRRRK